MEFKDVLNAHQLYKRKAKKVVVISSVTAICLLIAVFAISRVSSFLDVFFYISIVMLFMIFYAIILAFFITNKEAKAYKLAYKTYFVEKSLRQTFTDIHYDHEAGLERDALIDTQMINVGDSYTSNDYFTGKYKDVTFAQADAHIQVKRSDGEGNTSYITIFKGRFMIFEFPKKFNFRLEVVEKGFRAARLPGEDAKTGRKIKRIELESDEFNRSFKTYAEDDFEAFYLLGPDFINNILDLNHEYEASFMLGFLDNRLLIGLNDGKDAFEAPGVFKELDEAVETEKVTKDIRLITNFIDKLKLDHKLFKETRKDKNE